MPGDQEHAETTGTISGEQPLIIEAQLLDPGIPASRPGDMYVISLMHYQVLRVVEGIYPHELILVGHHNPNLSAPEFQIGVRHRLHLVRQFPKNASLLNKFVEEAQEIGSFFCLAFETLE